jgi:hypothetical protein
MRGANVVMVPIGPAPALQRMEPAGLLQHHVLPGTGAR